MATKPALAAEGRFSVQTTCRTTYDAWTMTTSDATDGTKRRYLLLTIAALLAGLLLRLWFIHRFAQVANDTLLYGDFARNTLQHGIYGFSQTLNGHPAPPRPTLIRLPGYPAFLALCFLVFGYDHYLPVLILQTLIDLATCCLIAALAHRLVSRRAGLIALWLGCLCPFTANFVAIPLTETLTLFTIALAFYALHRWQSYIFGQFSPIKKGVVILSEAQNLSILSGAPHAVTETQSPYRPFNPWLYLLAATLAYSILLRPEQGILAAAIIPAILYITWRTQPTSKFTLRTLRPAVIASLLTILPLIPWTIRNERTFHVFEPLAPRFATDPGELITLGFQRWYRTWAIDFASTETTYWNLGSDTLQIADLPNRAFDNNTQYATTEALYAEYNLTTTPTKSLDDRFATLAATRVRSNPIRFYLALPIARLINMAFRPRIDFLPLPLEWWKFRLHPRSTLFSYAYGALNLAYFALAAAAFTRRRTLFPNWPIPAPILWSMAGMILLRAALLLTIDNSEPRYTLEFFPILILLAASFTSAAHDRPRA
ncbi:glycosyltransferase family protein [Granulicella tundricola]|uniref:Uncharacterized protein n=1 Tax=Granulicella tundricola (strain ATCC BAA-1859 / DSM 23138 / MP5ACTX9) TaxID=1198114 RepID=E8X4B9_GRATM|nr:glycosyltransferase family 39 protein [Granulicella tundricola]ADW68246.1 hypothetical protein AciX9_1183 [Granulicella tundricola MP5ACTX9]